MKKASPFQKFAHKKSNAAIKEELKQGKRKAVKKAKEVANKRKWDRKKAEYKKSVEEVTRKELYPMPLNKYLAHCGIASRRESAEIVREGRVKVNEATVIEPGHKINKEDKVFVDNKLVKITSRLVYILINKPKDFITTTSDPKNRRTVMNLIKRATMDRVYPVGRLDRNTTGVLLMTNDGDLTQKLTHPSFEIKKIYEVKLDRPLEKIHFDAILDNVTLEDGSIHADALAFSDQQDKRSVGVEIHSGRNRIVRRMFEHFGYEIHSLDRVMFAGLTKKDVPRGRWRYLNETEIRQLKNLK